MFLSKLLSSKRPKRPVLSALLLAGIAAAALPMTALAQSLPGFTIFSGVRNENQLNYRLDFGGRSDSWDRYRLRISSKRMKLAVSQFVISYPDYYDGKFDTKDVEIIVRGKSVPIREVRWSQDSFVLEIFPQEPIPAGNDVEIQLSNVKNPVFGGTYYFNCQILTPGDVPLLRYIGTWIITIS
ncbi:MAG: DUF2808 domain-containing protein [Leptolyngbyaceae cyanobacterium bins.59]|nr:DUF2808 domain-containing protein [Leptolyngbyaceae cyanobacterium bins.59]